MQWASVLLGRGLKGESWAMRRLKSGISFSCPIQTNHSDEPLSMRLSLLSCFQAFIESVIDGGCLQAMTASVVRSPGREMRLATQSRAAVVAQWEERRDG